MEPTVVGWKFPSLVGTDSRRNFTFQLGAPGGLKGYQVIIRFFYFISNFSSWQGVVQTNTSGTSMDNWLTCTSREELPTPSCGHFSLPAEMFLFSVEGGMDKSTSDFFNPLYLSDDQFGGYGKLSKEEKENAHLYSGPNTAENAGRLCVWSNDSKTFIFYGEHTFLDIVEGDNYDSFMDFRKTLKLKCETDKQPAIFKFTPNASHPDTIYYHVSSFIVW